MRWRPKPEIPPPKQGTVRLRQVFAWIPMIDCDGFERWMERVWVREYWTYELRKFYGPTWVWRTSMVYPAGWTPESSDNRPN